MAIYRYNPASPIDEMEILKNERGGARAYIHAGTASPDQLADLQSKFSQMGWKGVPISARNKPVLELRGFKNVKQLTQFLDAGGFTQGPPDILKTAEDKKPFRDKWENMTLGLAGGAWVFGDANYLIYAGKQYQQELAKLDKGTNFFNRLNIGAGVGYMLGSAALLFYGNKDQSQNEIEKSSKKVYRYLLKEHANLPQETSLQQIVKREDKGLLGNMDALFTRYPSETLNTIYTGVGLLLAGAGLYRAVKPFTNPANLIKGSHAYQEALAHHIKEAKTEYGDIALGMVTLSSALVGLLVKEKKRLPGEKGRDGPIGAVMDWIEEKPLRATGVGYMISTMFHGWSSIQKYKIGDKLVRDTIAFRGAFVVANIVAEILVAVSSKGHGEGVQTDKSTDETVIATAAEAIARQKPAQQEILIHQLSGFMSLPDVLGGKAEDIAARLRTQLGTLKNNPWARNLTIAENIVSAPEKSEAAKPAPSNKISAPASLSKLEGVQQMQVAT